MLSYRIPLLVLCCIIAVPVQAQRTAKPVLHGRHWVAITGKPLGATAGAMMFARGGNAVDAACAMLGATSTMWDVLSWGGETQALIYDPNQKKVLGINALGVAPTGATTEFFKDQELNYPPEYGPLAAVTPGTPGGLMVMLAEYGTLSLADVLEPSIQMAEGYPIERSAARSIESHAERIAEWPYSEAVYLPNKEDENKAPREGQIFVQSDLAETLRKLVEAESTALEAGMSRKEAIYAAYDRFYRGDIAEELVRGTQEQGGLITMEDLDRWQVYIEEPDVTDYKGIQVYKLTSWVQGPVMLQALNMLENMDLQGMGYNSTRYIHLLYQVMNMVFADRDFYYGDPYFPPAEPMEGLLSKAYAKARLEAINWEANDPKVKPGDPYPFQGEENPYLHYLEEWSADTEDEYGSDISYESDFYAGTTSIQAADAEGWVVSITPSGGWIPAVIAGETGIGLSQRMQSFVLDPAENPYNLPEPGKRPRATLTPGMALKDGLPYLSFAVQGGDSQDQNLLQFFLNIVEFDLNVQEAVEAANINSFQMRGSFGEHEIRPGRLLLHNGVPDWVRRELREMNYTLTFSSRTSGPITAIEFDRKQGTMWGGASDHGDDYGIAW
ncbi:MAG: gamma-glutamyltransferase family protein [Rhodothermaceae bacterium]|nr:gamma-glutamyltransferase family protein [Rhodothermaceae bacterium]MYI84553.1 gamma-glutamyltransferase family protein [Rhodothermaceae bacterium]